MTCKINVITLRLHYSSHGVISPINVISKINDLLMYFRDNYSKLRADMYGCIDMLKT